MRYYSLAEFEEDIEKLSLIIPDNKYNSIYGIPRGGIPVAMALANQLGLPLSESADIPLDHKGILVVDDLIDSGKTIKPYIDAGYDVATLHIKNDDVVLPTYFFEKMDKNEWIEYWWEENEAPAEDSVIRLLEMIGEDPQREGLLETPKRFSKALQFLTKGYKQDPQELMKTFDVGNYDQIILLKDIELYSMCEHHMLPFIGRAHVGYIPGKKVIGISKIARIVDIFARRLQIQERLTDQITQCLWEGLAPVGVACVIEAHHLCMRMRGVSKQNSTMTTSSLKGIFLEDSSKGIAARREFMGLIK